MSKHPSAGCYNCGGDHLARDCTQPKGKKCYDCDAIVESIAEHRPLCSKSRKNKSLVNNFSNQANPINKKCYDCGLMVSSIPQHKLECTRLNQAPEKEVNLVDLFILLDVSSSMDMSSANGQSRLDQSKKIIKEIITAADKQDRVSLITFENEAYFKLQLHPVHKVINEIDAVLSKIYAKGQTALYDAIHLAFTKIKNKENKTRIIVLTDGLDNCSKNSLFETEILLSSYPQIEISIIHINGDSSSSSGAYEKLCENRGQYILTNDEDLNQAAYNIFKLK